MPLCALFYPEWSINDPKFLFESLLYWDRLGCIVPDEGFKPADAVWVEDQEMTKVLRDANERFVTPCVLTKEQKARAHRRIAEFAAFEAPRALRPEGLRSSDRSIMSVHKLAWETLELLETNRWTGDTGRDDIKTMSSAAADLVMAALVDECSSDQMPPVTNDPAGFAGSCDLVISSLGIPRGVAATQENKADDAYGDALSFLLEDVPHLGLENDRVDHKRLRKLLEARSKPGIEGLRSAFRKRVDDFLAAVLAAEEPQRRLIRDAFRDAVKQDFRWLRKDLRLVGVDALVTKEGLAAIALGAVVPGPGTIGGLAVGWSGYRKVRQDRLEKHWCSWLYAAERPRFSLL